MEISCFRYGIFLGEVYLLVKGAETAVLDRCIEGDVDIAEKHVVQYALVSV